MSDPYSDAWSSLNEESIEADRERAYARREDFRVDAEGYTEDDFREDEVQANYLTDAKTGL